MPSKLQFASLYAFGGIVLALAAAALMISRDVSEQQGDIIDQLVGVQTELADADTAGTLSTLQADVAATQVQIKSIFRQLRELREQLSDLSSSSEEASAEDESAEAAGPPEHERAAEIRHPLSSYVDLPPSHRARVNQAANLFLYASDTEIVELHFTRPGNDSIIRESDLPILEDLMWAYVALAQVSLDDVEQKIRNQDYREFGSAKEASAQMRQELSESQAAPDSLVVQRLPNGGFALIEMSEDVVKANMEFAALRRDVMRSLGAMNIGTGITRGLE